jgi:hypothetical protein
MIYSTNRKRFSTLHKYRPLLLVFCLFCTLVWTQRAFSAQLLQIQSIVNEPHGGLQSAVKIGANGNPVLAFPLNGNITVVRCGNSHCNTGNVTTTLSNTGGSIDLSMVLDANDAPVISYYYNNDRELRLVRCSDASCSSHTVNIVDATTSTIGQYNSIQLDAVGNPVISYYDAINLDLKLARCGNLTCTPASTTLSVVDSVGNVGLYTSLALDTAGNPLMSYHDTTLDDLKVAHCINPTCSAGTIFTKVDESGNTGLHTSLALNSAGHPVISYQDGSSADLQLAVCGDVNCSTRTIHTVDESSASTGFATSLALSANGNPRITYSDNSTNQVKLAFCNDLTCQSVNTFILDSFLSTLNSVYSAVTVDQDGRTYVSYTLGNSISTGVLKLALLIDDSSAPTANPSQLPAANAAGWNNSNVTVTWHWSDNVGGVGIDSANCLASSTASTDGTQTLTATCRDLVGNNNSATYDLQIDKTPPLVAVTGVTAGASYLLGAVPVAGCSTIDALSGVANPATVTVSGGNGDGTGDFTARCEGASDNAGNNAATVTVTYSVVAPTATPTNTPEPTATPTNTPEPTATPTNTPEPTATPTNTPEPTATPTNTPEPTATPTNTPEPTATPTNTPEPTATPTNTPEPTATPTNTPEPTATPTNTPEPTATPTDTPEPTATPTNTPEPTATPTNTPEPTATPTNTPEPTATPTNTPEPTATPTNTPEPTATPTNTPEPTATPTLVNAPPDTTLRTKPTNPSTSSSARFTYVGADGDGVVVGFECELDGGGFTACSSPKNYTNLTNGVHTFAVRAIDNNGLVDPTPATHQWEIVGNRTITIVHNASPDSTTTVHYSGSLGSFHLAEGNNTRPQSLSFVRPAGLYTITQSATNNWYLHTITCAPAAAATVNLGLQRVVVDTTASDVTCTFDNLRTGRLLAYTYHDRNGNGIRNNGEEVQGDWEITVAGEVVHPTLPSRPLQQSGVTGESAPATFYLPGGSSYTICETPQAGRLNTQPGNGVPCYTLAIDAATSTALYFGNRDSNLIQAAILVVAYHDRNGNGRRNNADEELLADIPFIVTGVISHPVTPGQPFAQTQTTLTTGARVLWVPQGVYTLCQAALVDWTNTQPGGGTLCYPLTVNTGSNQSFRFGLLPVVVGAQTNPLASADIGDELLDDLSAFDLSLSTTVVEPWEESDGLIAEEALNQRVYLPITLR